MAVTGARVTLVTTVPSGFLYLPPRLNVIEPAVVLFGLTITVPKAKSRRWPVVPTVYMAPLGRPICCVQAGFHAAEPSVEIHSRPPPTPFHFKRNAAFRYVIATASVAVPWPPP